MLMGLMEKIDIVQEQVGNVSREREILRKNQKEMLQIKTNKQTKKPVVTEMQHAFDSLISKLDVAEEKCL